MDRGCVFSGERHLPDACGDAREQKNDVCDGIALGFDYNAAFAATQVSREEFNAKGDPLPAISRAKMASALAGRPLEKNLPFIVPLKRFSGKASLARAIAAGNPYAAIEKRG
jgi:hypothetical protein